MRRPIRCGTILLLASLIGMPTVGTAAQRAPAPQKAPPSRKPAPRSSTPAAKPTAPPSVKPSGVKPTPAPTPKGYPFTNVHPRTVPIKPFTFDPPEPRREVLPNGLVIYLMEDHDLPVFNISAYTKVGGIYVPPEKAGLGGLTGTVMRTGGTEELTGDEIDRRLEFVGARVETSIGAEYGTASGTSLIKDSDLVIEILNGILRNPAFREEKLELARGQVLEALRRQNDDPNAISAREFSRLVYGRESPYALVPTVRTVRNVKREDLREFHRRFYHPNNTILAVSGDFKSEEMLARLRKAFGSWERKPVEFPKLDPVREVEKRQVYVVTRDLPQTVVRMGHLGMRRHSPDEPAVSVLNEIFGGGGFSSRLMREVRSNRGLAYSVGAIIRSGPDRGLYLAAAQTKTESASETAELIADLMEEIRSKPVTAEEVNLAKESILNSYVFQFDSAAEIARQRALLELQGFPADYLETYPAKIRAVTPADVRTAAQKYLHPDRMVVLFVGKTEGLTPPNSKLGPATPLELEPVDDPASKMPDERKVP
ncbi:MAG: insulinase family protein [Armatimonadetes bacterium]|nr:insulinase family protein [Armatimonadota bacterium]